MNFTTVNVAKRKALDFRAGDTVKVSVKVQEKGKTRLQVFEGLVLCRKHGTEQGATFTVRKIASGVGTERIFPLYSPLVDTIEVVKRSKVRQSKLYHIREKAAKEIRRSMRRERTAKDEDNAQMDADDGIEVNADTIVSEKSEE